MEISKRNLQAPAKEVVPEPVYRYGGFFQKKEGGGNHDKYCFLVH